MIQHRSTDYAGFEALYPDRKRYSDREHRSDLVSRIIVFIIVAGFFVFMFSLLFIVFLDAPWWTFIPLSALGLYGAIWLAYRLDKKFKAVMGDHLHKRLEVFHVCTSRAVKKAGSGEMPPAFYIEVDDAGTLKTFFLCNLTVDELHFEQEFPNTEFILYLDHEADSIVYIDLKGQYLKPEKTLLPFTYDDFAKEKVPGDCSLVEKNIDELT